MSSDRAVRMPWMALPLEVAPAAIRRVIARIDDGLSRRAEVQPYAEDAACMLRIAPTRARHVVRLSDGAEIRPGDLVLDVHCWNERVPAMPEGGADLAWALKTAGRLRHSLVLLARAVETDPALQNTRAVRARVNFVGLGGSNKSVSRIIARMGFEDVDEGRGAWPERVHDVLENVLIAALVWTHNPAALRRDKLLRERRPVWCSRERLASLHGSR